MGADMKALRTRIRSVGSTLQLTKAMGLVASSKLRRAAQGMHNARAYAAAVTETVKLLTASPECAKSPYMQVRDTGRVKLIVIAGDRGLAGGYNANVFRLVREWPGADIVPLGKRACERYGGEVISSERLDYAAAAALSRRLCEEFAAGAYDTLGIVGTEYVSMMTQTPRVEWILPLTAPADVSRRQVVFEPDELTVLNAAVSEYVTGRLMAAVREGFACEVTARRMAMDAAGKNATQMIDELQLQYNRARQGAITQEITEIVAGSGL